MVDQYAMKDIEMRHPDVYRMVDDIFESDVSEYTLTLTDGSKVIYDGLNSCLRSVREERGDELSSMPEEDWRYKFSIKLNRRAQCRGMNQGDLSEESGISKVMVGKYLNGKSTPNAYNLAKLARALGCSVSDLVDF